ncbi:vit family domain-containing protein [Alternaria burnsii]|uniref:Vit family domain-containing protein n=1 Tax=Alternaria burnsii TaxID=1187904 RepID=A0A8H7EBZ8_9PLEO|nr:vit family domain-containing protein [Alternaria burnsii]KAF7672925.1 vit family domain-containing protein [Alternaria burnsii]
MAPLASVHYTAPVPRTASALPMTTTTASTSDPAECRNKDLLDYIQRSIDQDEEFHFLRFEKLQRTNLVALQMKLIRTKDALSKASTISDDDLEKLRATLEQYGKHTRIASYTTAIQNYHSLRDRKSLTLNDAVKRELVLQRYFQSQVKDIGVFKSHYSYFDVTDVKIDSLRSLLMERLPVWMTYSRNERSTRRREYRDGKPPKEVSGSVDRLCRFIIAAIGGLFLVGPMLIMAIRPSTAKSLITVSASVFLFAVLLTFGVRVTNIEGLVSTATYAAVLVVFVGSSTGGGNEAVRLASNGTLA